MYRRNDPRLRRTINQFAQNLESANEQAQEGIYDFGQRYISPCLGSIGDCFHSCFEPCFPGDDDQRRRRQRGRSRGRAEISFDFYDDWDDDLDDSIAWGDDELDSLLTGSGSAQPGAQAIMNYGTTNDKRNKRKSISIPHEGTSDPTVIPKSSYLGFLDRIPWLSHKGLKYKPSAADLQEHPAHRRRNAAQKQPLLEDSDEEIGYQSQRRHKRVRSGTATSGHTTDSLSSRGDIFPSEDELEDAVPLDDEFAFALERRNTGLGDDASGGRSKSRKSSRSARASIRTVSSRSVKSLMQQVTTPDDIDEEEPPTIAELKAEEDAVKQEEDGMVERKRQAAYTLARRRGLSSHDSAPNEMVESRPQSPISPLHAPHRPMSPSVVPFPAFDVTRRAASMASRSQSEEHLPSSARESDTDQPVDFVPAALPRFQAKPD